MPVVAWECDGVCEGCWVWRVVGSDVGWVGSVVVVRGLLGPACGAELAELPQPASRTTSTAVAAHHPRRCLTTATLPGPT
jgi:hypothetical protein